MWRTLTFCNIMHPMSLCVSTPILHHGVRFPCLEDVNHSYVSHDLFISLKSVIHVWLVLYLGARFPRSENVVPQVLFSLCFCSEVSHVTVTGAANESCHVVGELCDRKSKCHVTQFGRCDCVSTFLALFFCSATHCNTLQHTTTHSNTQQHAASHYITPQHAATRCSPRWLLALLLRGAHSNAGHDSFTCVS